MSYLDDLDINIRKAEKHITDAEYAQEQGWDTAYDFCISAADSVIKSIRHCVECAKQKQTRLEPGKKFTCDGKCVDPDVFDRFPELNSGLWYMMTGQTDRGGVMDIKKIKILIKTTRQHLEAAKTAKAIGWTDEGDLYDYSINTAEEQIAELEKLVADEEVTPCQSS